MSPRNRVTTPPPSLPLSLRPRREISLRERREGISARVFSFLVTSPLPYAQRDDFSFPRSTEPASPPLPSFLARQFFTANVDRQRGSASSRPFDRGNVGRNEISFQFFSTFMRLWEGRKLIRRKAEDKAGAAKSAWFFDREEPVSNHGEEQSREVSHVGKGRREEGREEIPRLYDNNGR